MYIKRNKILTAVLCLCLLCSVFTGCQSREAAAAEKLIGALDISAPDAEAVAQAREAFDALTEEEKAGLENADLLRQAEVRVRAGEVTAQIAALGAVTLEDASAVEEARKAYDALSAEERALVEGEEVLATAEKTVRRLQVEAAAEEIDALIEAVGEVGLDSGGTIEEARAAYDAADEEVRSAVRLADTLTEAEETLHRLEVEDAAAKFDASVAALGEITLESEDAIRVVREAYNGLSGEVRDAVTSLDALTAAEEKLTFLKKKARADEVDAAIAALGEVTLESEAEVQALRAEYDALPEEIRELVTLSGTLDKAEGTIQTLKDKAAAAEVKKLSDEKKYDEAIALAEEYMKGRPVTGDRGGVVKNCLKAYAAKANALMKKDRNEEAYGLLKACLESYADADLTDVNAVWNSLKKAIAEPKSGQIFSKQAQGGYCTFTVEAGDYPAFIKLVNTKDAKSAISFYVRAHGKTTVHVKNGTYEVRYATGEKWFGSKELFGSGTRYKIFDDKFSFTTKNNGRYINYTTWSVTLYSVAGGTGSTSTIPEDRF